MLLLDRRGTRRRVGFTTEHAEHAGNQINCGGWRGVRHLVDARRYPQAAESSFARLARPPVDNARLIQPTV